MLIGWLLEKQASQKPFLASSLAPLTEANSPSSERYPSESEPTYLRISSGVWSDAISSSRVGVSIP